MLIGEGQCDRRLRSGGRGSSAPHRRQQHVRRRVVAERLAHMREADDVARGEDEAAAELKRVVAEAVLAMPGRPTSERAAAMDELMAAVSSRAAAPTQD